MTPDDLAGQMARLEDAWGAPKDRSPAQFVGMTREWFGQLERFGVRTVESAFTSVIGLHKFQWAGALPEILTLCAKDDYEWRDALGLVQEPRRGLEDWTGRGERFERAGRTTEEEIQHRVAEIAAMKRDAGFNSAPEGISAPREDARPASTSIAVSSQLRNSCAARRARNEPTCEDSCAKQRCELREREHTLVNQPQRPHTASSSPGINE